VLAPVYGLSAEAVERVLQADTLLVQNEEEIFTAMTALTTGAGTFSDALIRALGAWAGCTGTLTFDQKAKRLKYFRLLHLSGPAGKSVAGRTSQRLRQKRAA
jgi:predicted nucleic-acid-binding protein